MSRLGCRLLMVGFTYNFVRVICGAVKGLGLSCSLYKICCHTCIWNIDFSSWSVPTRNMQIPLNVSILNLHLGRYFIQDNIFCECQAITTTINDIVLNIVSRCDSSFTCVVLYSIEIVIYSDYLILFCSHSSTTRIVATSLKSFKIL